MWHRQLAKNWSLWAKGREVRTSRFAFHLTKIINWSKIILEHKLIYLPSKLFLLNFEKWQKTFACMFPMKPSILIWGNISDLVHVYQFIIILFWPDFVHWPALILSPEWDLHKLSVKGILYTLKRHFRKRYFITSINDICQKKPPMCLYFSLKQRSLLSRDANEALSA